MGEYYEDEYYDEYFSYTYVPAVSTMSHLFFVDLSAADLLAIS